MDPKKRRSIVLKMRDAQLNIHSARTRVQDGLPVLDFLFERAIIS